MDDTTPSGGESPLDSARNLPIPLSAAPAPAGSGFSPVFLYERALHQRLSELEESVLQCKATQWVPPGNSALFPQGWPVVEELVTLYVEIEAVRQGVGAIHENIRSLTRRIKGLEDRDDA